MSQRPNILFVFTDQQRADTLGVRNPVMRTPVLDRLCAEGTLFTQAHTPVPVCVPARCSLIFGQYATRTGCYENSYPMPEVSAERPTFMSLLTAAGYQTHGVGKMHFTPDSRAMRGFETRVINEELAGPGADAYTAWLHEQGYDHILDPNGVRGEMYYIPQPAQMPARAHNTQWTADRCIDFLRQRDPKRPFFLWSSFIHPHPPFSPPVPWNKLYRAPAMPLPKRPSDPENFWTFINRVQNRYKYRDAGIDDNLLRAMKAYYYACVSFIDYNVGRILAVLEELGELENTLILWGSDHGEFLGDYNCFGKRSFLGSAARVPLVVRYPERFQPGNQVNAPASLVDIMPTFLAAAEVDAGGCDLDGVDLAALARQPATRPVVFGHYQSGRADSYGRGLYMALTRRWKYIYSAAENREFLFDLHVDPEETRNRAETIGYLEQTRAMRRVMVEQLRAAGRDAVLDGEGWRVFPPPQFARDPDSGLLFQDAAWAMPHLNLPGYSETEPGPLSVNLNW
jgi:choline-sulfatase